LRSENYPGFYGDGCEAPVFQPAHSHDLNPLIFLLWGYLKSKVYANTVDTREELQHQIQQFASEIKNIPGTFKWLPVSFHTELSCVSVNMEAVQAPLVRK
jgi:predicted metal-dependent enzyme (double-stranded beta helix superfamily)